MHPKHTRKPQNTITRGLYFYLKRAKTPHYVPFLRYTRWHLKVSGLGVENGSLLSYICLGLVPFEVVPVGLNASVPARFPVLEHFF